MHLGHGGASHSSTYRSYVLILKMSLAALGPSCLHLIYQSSGKLMTVKLPLHPQIKTFKLTTGRAASLLT